MLRILIVDDEPIFRMGLRAGISWSEYGCEIIGEASNGREALSIIQTQNPDIIFLDIKMPGMDAVSYTHLDVYKRQLSTSASASSCVRILRIWILSLSTGMKIFASRSFTGRRK